MRFSWIAISFAVTLPQCARAPVVPPGQEAAVLDVVVDSLPFAIRNTWGVEQDQPYTALLNSNAPTTRVNDPRPRQEDEANAPTADHPREWLDRQVAKEHVAGTCSPDPDGEYCDFALATVVVTLSRVRFIGDDRASVEVGIGRRDFASISELTLQRTAGAWALAEFDLIVIS